MLRRALPLVGTLLLAASTAGCALFGYPAPVPGSVRAAAGRVIADRPSSPEQDSYEVLGRTYTTLASSEDYSQSGLASWYGGEFQGRPTASGEPFDMYALTAAHRTLPLGTCIEVKRISNGRTVTVRVNDRGPFDDDQTRIIDLSYAAGEKLGLIGAGTASIQLKALPTDASC